MQHSFSFLKGLRFLTAGLINITVLPIKPKQTILEAGIFLNPCKSQPQQRWKLWHPLGFARLLGPLGDLPPQGRDSRLSPRNSRLVPSHSVSKKPHIPTPRHRPRTLRLARRPRLLAKFCRSQYLKEFSSSREGTIMANCNPGNHAEVPYLTR